MSVKILVTGDFYGGSNNGSTIGELFESHNYIGMFEDFKSLASEHDLVITNLESPIIKKNSPIEKTGPILSAKTSALHALKLFGVNLVTLSNNHILDHGFDGLKNTLAELNNCELDFVGAGLNIEEASKPFIGTFNDRSIGVLNFSENEWASAKIDGFGANPLDPIQNYYTIAELKIKVDFTCVILHGGNEYYHLPSPRLKKICRFFIDAGADVVIMHHSHFISGFELYNDKKIYFGLGNFLFDKSAKSSVEWHRTLGISIVINDDGSVTDEVIPMYQTWDTKGVRIQGSEEAKQTFDLIDDLNMIINDDSKLEKLFLEFIESNRRQYYSFFQPYNGKLRALYKKGLLPSVLSRDYRKLILNLIRCEAHRDVIIEVIQRSIRKDK